MREKYDPHVRNYNLFALITSSFILLFQFFSSLKIITVILSMIFGLFSIAMLVYFVKREYNSSLLMVPIYFLSLMTLYYGFKQMLFWDWAIVVPFLQIVGIIFAIALMVGSVAIMYKYKR